MSPGELGSQFSVCVGTPHLQVQGLSRPAGGAGAVEGQPGPHFFPSETSLRIRDSFLQVTGTEHLLIKGLEQFAFFVEIFFVSKWKLLSHFDRL